jgi:hypothetical protein
VHLLRDIPSLTAPEPTSEAQILDTFTTSAGIKTEPPDGSVDEAVRATAIRATQPHAGVTPNPFPFRKPNFAASNRARVFAKTGASPFRMPLDRQRHCHCLTCE